MRIFEDRILIDTEVSQPKGHNGRLYCNVTCTVYEIHTDLKWWAVRQLPKLTLN